MEAFSDTEVSQSPVEPPFKPQVESQGNSQVDNNCARFLEKLSASDIFVGSDPKFAAIYERIFEFSRKGLNFLIIGESGTGKEIVAQAVKQARGSIEPFVSVNVAALSSSVIESELFGHVKGAFTGATGDRVGAFRKADGGTLFLDEIGDLSSDLQVKLLRVLSTGEVLPVGADSPVKVNVKIVAATNQDLNQKITSGAFRKDLYFRLRQVVIQLPALRERYDDIPGLAETLVRKISAQHQMTPVALSQSAIDLLRSLTWEGNVRELEQVLTLAVLSEKTGQITSESLLNVLPAGPVEIPSLAQDLVNLRAKQTQRELVVLTEHDINELQGMNFENARALFEYLEKYLIVSETPQEAFTFNEASVDSAVTTEKKYVRFEIPEGKQRLNNILSAFHRAFLEELLRVTNGNLVQASNISGERVDKLTRWLKMHDLLDGHGEPRVSEPKDETTQNSIEVPIDFSRNVNFESLENNLKKQLVNEAFSKSQGSVNTAASYLGVDRQVLRRILKKFGISVGRRADVIE